MKEAVQHLLDLPERTIVSVQGRRQPVPIRFTPDPWVQPPLLDLTPNNCACSAAGYAWTASRSRCLPCCLTRQDPEDEQLCVYSLQQEARTAPIPDAWVQPPLLDPTPNNCACSAAGYAWTASRFRCLPCCLTRAGP